MSLLEKASLILTPNAVKASKLYSIVPSTGNGDMDVVRATSATRVNSLGLIENIASNVARLNYDGSCPSILLEPQRTNLVTYSEDFSFWGITELNTSGTPPYINQGISPNGTLTADKIIPNIVNSVHRYINTNPVIPVASNYYTFSVFMKKNDFDYCFFRENINGTYENTFFNLASVGTGTIGAGRTAIIKDYGNGWIRCSVTSIATSTSISIGIGVSNANNSISIIGDNVKFNYIWGAQLEQGSYPTSYIPTVASTVTRNADVISKTGISDLIGQTEGVMFVESAALANDLIQKRISISDGTSANRIYLYYSSTSNVVSLFGQSNGINFSTVISYDLTDRTQFAKIAIRYKVNDISLWVNGINRGTLTSQALPINLSRLGFDAQGLDFHSKTKQVQLYKTYLTDTEMANLTTI